MKKVMIVLFGVLLLAGAAEYYSHTIIKEKKVINEDEISKLLAEKKEREEKLKLMEVKLKRFEEENKDLKELKEGKK